MLTVVHITYPLATSSTQPKALRIEETPGRTLTVSWRSNRRESDNYPRQISRSVSCTPNAQVQSAGADHEPSQNLVQSLLGTLLLFSFPSGIGLRAIVFAIAELRH